MASKVQGYESLDQSNACTNSMPIANTIRTSEFSAAESIPSSKPEINLKNQEDTRTSPNIITKESKSHDKTAQIISKWQNCEQEIRKHRYMVIINWILIGWGVIGGIAGIFITAFSAGILKSVCASISELSKSFITSKIHNQETFTYIHESCVEFLQGINIQLVMIGVMVVVILHGLIILCHYKGIQAYQKRSLEAMEFVFLFYTTFLVLNMLMMNCFGMVMYGYLAYTSHKLKVAFVEMKRIENFMVLRGIDPNDEVEQLPASKLRTQSS